MGTQKKYAKKMGIFDKIVTSTINPPPSMHKKHVYMFLSIHPNMFVW